MPQCVYCGNTAEVRDHFIPWSYNHVGNRKNAKAVYRSEKKNLVASCRECNAIAGNKVFDTLQEKQAYIAEHLEIKYKKTLRLPDWTEGELKELAPKLRKNTKLRLLAKKWVVNRIHYPTVIYPEQPIREQMKEILNLF